MIINRVWAMPSAATFSIIPIKDFVERHILTANVIVDPFANSCRYGTLTNDLNPEYETTYHMDALDFLSMLPDNSADVVLYDPPYSARQASECYKQFGKEKLTALVTNDKYWSDCRKEVVRILKPNAKVLCFGWNSNGMGGGLVLEEVLLVAHGGFHNDTICTQFRKIQNTFIF